jgi:hypothetical protein
MLMVPLGLYIYKAIYKTFATGERETLLLNALNIPDNVAPGPSFQGLLSLNDLANITSHSAGGKARVKMYKSRHTSRWWLK